MSSADQIRICAAIVFREDPGSAFTAVIQLGPTLAVILYFWKDIVKTGKGWAASLGGGASKDSHDAKLGWGVIYGTIPILILGFALRTYIEKDLRSLYWSAGALIVMGIVMLIADYKPRQNRSVEDVEVKDGVVVGLWQCLALIPGASRSGSTIAGSLFRGFTREAAARFSFLLSIPSFTAAGVYEAINHKHELTGAILTPLAVALVVSFFVGLACIHWFLRYLQKHGIAPFVAYRVVVGILVLYMVMSGQVDPNAGAKPLDSSPAATQTVSRFGEIDYPLNSGLSVARR